MFRILLITLLTIIVTVLPLTAQDDLVVGNIATPTFSWGKQTAEFEITNNSDWFRFATVETEISFKGTYLSPSRIVHSHFPLIPGETVMLNPTVEVPGNYGSAILYIRIFDVIDTLDLLMASQKIFEKEFKLTFNVPDEVSSYFESTVMFPPMVDNNPIWDNEFTHVLPLLISEGKTVEEIAAMTNADISYVQGVMSEMVISGALFYQRDGTYRNQFPVFKIEQAKKTKAIVEVTSDKMADLIAKNLIRYPDVLDSMIKAGTLSPDKDDFMGGGAALYSEYPTVAGLLMWFELGQAFISGKEPLTIFKQTNPCHANLGKYMYAVQGGDNYSGHHFFYLNRKTKQYDIRFGDNIPVVECNEGFMVRKILREMQDYRYGANFTPEPFMVSAAVVAPALRALSEGSQVVFDEIRAGLSATSQEFGFKEVTIAERYWFWNMFASSTVDKLVERGALTRNGNGMYKFAMSR